MIHEITNDLEQKILHYLLSHPEAADTAEGITMWWLGKNLAYMEIKKVEEALNNLVTKGVLRCRKIHDGHVLYSRVSE